MYNVDDIITKDQKEYKIKEKTCSMCKSTQQVAIEHGHGNWRAFNLNDWKTWNASRCPECHKLHNSIKRKKKKNECCDMCGKPIEAKTSKKRYCGDVCRTQGYQAMAFAKRDARLDVLLKEANIPDNSHEFVKKDEESK